MCFFIADKIDTICGVFAAGRIPTGSADPLGLRRAALGTLRTVIDKNLKVNLSAVIENSLSLQPLVIEDKAKLTATIREFIIQRLKVYLTDTYKYDVVDAAMAVKDPLADLNDLIERVRVISELVKKEDYSSFHEAANRIMRILKSQEHKALPDESLFVHEAETQLWICVKGIDTGKLSYNELVEQLEGCIPAVEEFFDKVLVMDKDERVKENRISLLGNLREKFNQLGDFSRIVA